MPVNYVLIAGLLMYIGMIRLFSWTDIGPVKAAVLVMLGYFGLDLFVRGSLLLGHGVSIWSLFGVVPLGIALVQFMSMAVIFYKIQESGDSYEAYFGWAIAGFILTFLVIPSVIGRILMGF